MIVQLQQYFLQLRGYKITKSIQMWLQCYLARDISAKETAILRRGMSLTSGE